MFFGFFTVFWCNSVALPFRTSVSKLGLFISVYKPTATRKLIFKIKFYVKFFPKFWSSHFVQGPIQDSLLWSRKTAIGIQFTIIFSLRNIVLKLIYINKTTPQGWKGQGLWRSVNLANELANVADKLIQVADELTHVADKLTNVADKLKHVADELKHVADKLKHEADKLKLVADELTKRSRQRSWYS